MPSLTEGAAARRPLRVLGLASLFPNAEMPAHGIFLRHRLAHLAARPEVALRMVAPIPWFPSRHAVFGRYAAFARAATESRSDDLDVLHPRHLAIPRIGMSAGPGLMAAGLVAPLARLRRQGFDFDVIDAYYLYPDGVAAALLGALFRRPVVLSALGSDVSLIPRWAAPRAQIRWAIRRADGLTAVCSALRDGLLALEPAGPAPRVVEHGVDLDLFRPPADRAALRAALGLTGPTLVSVGHLIPRKGHDVAIRGLRLLPGVALRIVGTGPEEAALRALARAEGVAGRVAFLGQLPQPDLAALMGAANALVLCSDREGIANVLLEAIACGTPVVATPVWGTPAVVTAPAAGRLMRGRCPAAMAEAVRALLADPPARNATRGIALRYRWAETARQHLAVLQDAYRAAQARGVFVGEERTDLDARPA